MDDITFVKTRHIYDSYSDFWELVRLSGFPTIYIDEIDLASTGTFIVAPMNGEWKQWLDSRSNFRNRLSTLMLWNLERPGGSGTLQQYTLDNQALIDAGYLDTVIVSDNALARDTGFHFVPLGSNAGLVVAPYINPEHKEFDLIHLSCYSSRRSPLFQHPGIVKPEVYGMKVAPNGWGSQRAYNLKHSKFMLNIHQDQFPYCEPLRFALAYAHKLTVISERCKDPWPYGVHPYPGYSTLADTLKYAKECINSYESDIETYEFISNANFIKFTTEFSFRNCIEKFL